MTELILNDVDLPEGKETVEPIAAQPIPPNLIQIKIKSQYSEKLISVEENSSISELKAIVASKFGCNTERVVLMWDGKVVSDSDTFPQLNIVNNSRLHLVIRPEQEVLSSFCDFARLGVGRTDFVQLQKDLQKKLSNNPDMLRQLVGTPLVQQLMANPSVATQLISLVPQANIMLQRNSDIVDMLNNEETMSTSLKIAQDPELLQELIDSLEAEGNTSANKVPADNEEARAELPSTQAMLRLMAQDSQSIHTMLQAPYLPTILQHMKHNPSWANKLIMENSLLSTNAPLQQQMMKLLPAYLQQMENPDVVAMMEKPQALQAMLRIQRGLHVLQQHAPNIHTTTGLAYLSSNENEKLSEECTNNIDVKENDNSPLATNLIMSEIVQHMASNKLKRPLDERYSDELDLMEEMGYTQRDSNLEILMKNFGNVDLAVSQLLSHQT